MYQQQQKTQIAQTPTRPAVGRIGGGAATRSFADCLQNRVKVVLRRAVCLLGLRSSLLRLRYGSS